MNNANAPTTVPPLALRPKDAAKALGIGQRKLWALSQPRGPIPCIRVGRCVMYPVHLLKAWLEKQAAKSEGGCCNADLIRSIAKKRRDSGMSELNPSFEANRRKVIDEILNTPTTNDGEAA